MIQDTKSLYECSICSDREWIINEKDEAMACSCREVKMHNRISKNSGISDVFKNKTFSNFCLENKDKVVLNAKKAAMDYVVSFENVRNKRENSIAFLGQVGSGKTHLSIAVANNLMAKNTGVIYMQYREAITNIKQSVNDEFNYANAINKYKNASVLLIDDLFKKATYRSKIGEEILNDADARVIFEIINFRYLKGSPIIVSSEYSVNKILELDEAIGSRIIEMCKGRIINFEGKNLNHRLAIFPG